MRRNAGKKVFIFSLKDYLTYVLVAVLITLEAIIALALLFPPRIGPAIDLTAAYQPLPAWYFLWLYQLLRYFPGHWAVFGAVLLPALLLLAFIMLPYIDRGPKGRIKAVAVSAAMLTGLAVLTLIPILTGR